MCMSCVTSSVVIRVLPPASNPCGSNNGGCEQVCVLSHRTDNGGLGFRCKCEFGFELHADERHCVGKKSAWTVGIPRIVCACFCPTPQELQRSLCREPFKLRLIFSFGSSFKAFLIFSPEISVPRYSHELLAMAFIFYMTRFELYFYFYFFPF